MSGSSISLGDRLRRGSDEDIEAIETMVKTGNLDPNRMCNRHNLSNRPIHFPVIFDHQKLVIKLMELGADPNSVDETGTHL